MNDLERALNDAGFETTRLDKANVRQGPTWECKIGLRDDKSAVLPGGCDLPMREAVEAAFQKIVGQEPDFVFSGWGAELTPTQRHVEYNEDGCFAEAMSATVMKEVEEWEPEMLRRLIRTLKALEQKKGSST